VIAAINQRDLNAVSFESGTIIAVRHHDADGSVLAVCVTSRRDADWQ
jgi:hypothetical protein